MKLAGLLCLVALAAQTIIQPVLSQTTRTYLEPTTGLTFYVNDVSTSDTNGGFSFGYVVPSGTNPTNEYIGLFIGALNNSMGWSGISHGGEMPDSLLLMAWPDGKNILSSFRYATGYVAPDIYTGNATATTITSSVNSTHFTWIYHCTNCFAWEQDGAAGSMPTTSFQVLGWAQNSELPVDPSDPDSSIGTLQHDNGEGEFGMDPTSATFTGYSSWLSAYSKTAVPTTSATHTSTASSSATASATISSLPVPTATWDYIVVGGGAGGIPIADKLSQAGHSVLLIERGPASSYRWGGMHRPAWLNGSNLTRFDVPGLCNEIWVDSAGIACPDVGEMSGCVLGGGTAVNAGLWWNPPTIDWDYNFPTGWKSTDMAPAQSRVFSRIPGTEIPSLDGKLYLQQGYGVVSSGLAKGGWTNLDNSGGANANPQLKNHTFSHTPFMYSHGERGGPMATYLVTAHARSNFGLWMNTTVSRVIRNGSHITGVEVEAFNPGGYSGVVNVTSGTGRVVLSAGTFGTPKILYRSGIGPTDQLDIVANSSTDGATMIHSSQWINLPVGHNLIDQVDTDCVISHPNVTFYDFYAAYNTPIASDASAYLNSRDGILASAAPNIGPMFWDEIPCADGITRQLQWTARVEGSLGAANGNTMTLSQYLGRGQTSRGLISITPDLDMEVSTLPYLQNQYDIQAVVQGITNMQNALKLVPNLTFLDPAPGTSVANYVANYVVSASARTSNHWMGTCKMGTDSGLNSGTSVVDTSTKVYGTSNLFVVDASIFPGQVTTNPSAFIVTVAERASEQILALSTTSAGYGQCGGSGWIGPTVCASGWVCTVWNPYYSQCTQ